MQRGTREYALWSIGILLILTFSICPVLWIVSVSLKAPATITEGTNFGNTFIPQDITFDNYDALFTGGISESPFLKPLINSILIGLISTVIAIVLAAFAAYAIARLDFPGKTLILAAALAFFTGESQFTEPTGNIAAAGVIVTVPIIIFVLIFQRRIVAGLTSGAVKG